LLLFQGAITHGSLEQFILSLVLLVYGECFILENVAAKNAVAQVVLAKILANNHLS
jgi:hypothetical protein